MDLLENKVALVTGAGGGLGRAHALLLAKEGAAVIVNDLGGARDGTGASSNMADQVVAEIKSNNGRAIANHGSVSDANDANEMVQMAIDNFGKLDICICNAGILRDKSFKNMTNEMWDIVVDVHLGGTYKVSKAAYDHMVARGAGGSILMTSSTSGLIGNFGQTNYGAAKAGIAGFMRCLAIEGMKYNIRVNLLVPTAWSRLTEDIMPETVKDHLAPEKVSPAPVWLCSDEASDITGRIFAVSGNKVSLLHWENLPIASKSNAEEPWSVADIGREIERALEKAPKPLKTSDLM